MPEAVEAVIDVKALNDWQAAGQPAQLVDMRLATELATAHILASREMSQDESHRGSALAQAGMADHLSIRPQGTN